MKLGLLLALGLVLVGGVTSMSYVQQLGDDSEICKKCIDGVKDLEGIIIPKLNDFVDDGLKSACKHMWALKKTCHKYGKKLLKPVEKIIEDYLKGEKLCKLVKVCTDGESNYSPDDFDFSDEKTACVKCQLLVNKAKDIVMHKKELLRDVVLNLHGQCENDELGFDEDMCKGMVNAFGVGVVDAAIAGFSEFDACSASELC